MEQAASIGLDIVTLSSHTSHTLQPLDVDCFKPLKSTYKKEIDVYMLTSKFVEPDKVVFALWMDRSIHTTLTNATIQVGFCTKELATRPLFSRL